MDGYCLMTVSFATTATIIHTFIIITLVCHLNERKDARLSTLLSVISVLCLLFIDATRAVAYGLPLIASSDSTILFFYSIHVLLSQICTIIFPISFINLLIWRLYTSFKNTSFEISQKVLILLVSCPIIIISSLIVCFVIKSLIIITLAAVAGIIAVIAINYLFSSKLMKLLIPMHVLDVKSSYNRMYSDSNCNHQQSGKNDIKLSGTSVAIGSTTNDSKILTSTATPNAGNQVSCKLKIELSDQQVPFIQLIGKHSLLTFLQSITIIFWMVSLSLNGLTHQDTVLCKNNNQIALYVARVCSTLPNIIVPICIWFSFAFAKKKYYCMCGMCHSICLSQFQQIAIKKIDASIRNTTGTSYPLREFLLE